MIEPAPTTAVVGAVATPVCTGLPRITMVPFRPQPSRSTQPSSKKSPPSTPPPQPMQPPQPIGEDDPSQPVSSTGARELQQEAEDALKTEIKARNLVVGATHRRHVRDTSSSSGAGAGFPRDRRDQRDGSSSRSHTPRNRRRGHHTGTTGHSSTYKQDSDADTAGARDQEQEGGSQRKKTRTNDRARSDNSRGRGRSDSRPSRSTQPSSKKSPPSPPPPQPMQPPQPIGEDDPSQPVSSTGARELQQEAEDALKTEIKARNLVVGATHRRHVRDTSSSSGAGAGFPRDRRDQRDGSSSRSHTPRNRRRGHHTGTTGHSSTYKQDSDADTAGARDQEQEGGSRRKKTRTNDRARSDNSRGRGRSDSRPSRSTQPSSKKSPPSPPPPQPMQPPQPIGEDDPSQPVSSTGARELQQEAEDALKTEIKARNLVVGATHRRHVRDTSSSSGAGAGFPRDRRDQRDGSSSRSHTPRNRRRGHHTGTTGHSSTYKQDSDADTAGARDQEQEGGSRRKKTRTNDRARSDNSRGRGRSDSRVRRPSPDNDGPLPTAAPPSPLVRSHLLTTPGTPGDVSVQPAVDGALPLSAANRANSDREFVSDSVVLFWKPPSCFSNWTVSSFTVLGVLYESAPKLPTTWDRLPAHLRDIVFELHDPRWSAAAIDQLGDALIEYADVFSTSKCDFGVCNSMPFSLSVPPGTKPVASKPYRINPILQKKVDAVLDQYMTAGLIQHSTSPWASPLVVIPKKDGSVRITVNYKRLNALVEMDGQPLPRVDGILDSLYKGKVFSIFDPNSAFHQIVADPDTVPLTAFCTPTQLFEFLRMPQGANASPAWFVKAITKVVHGMDNVKAYLDDVICLDENPSEHVRKMTAFFGRLCQYNLKLSSGKARIGATKANFLGHTISPAGVTPDSEKVRALAQMPSPSNVRQLRSLLGGLSYYRKFLPNLAVKVRPLTSLLKQGVSFEYPDSMKAIVKTLLAHLSTSPVFVFPDWDVTADGSRPLRLCSDACIDGFGACLEQEQPDKTVKPIVYISRATIPAERNWAVLDLEAGSIVWALKRLRGYRWSTHFEIYTDHQALTSIAKVGEHNARVQRWLEYLSNFSYTLIYRKGTANGNADFLSGLPLPAAAADISGPDSIGDVDVQGILLIRETGGSYRSTSTPNVGLGGLRLPLSSGTFRASPLAASDFGDFRRHGTRMTDAPDLDCASAAPVFAVEDVAARPLLRPLTLLPLVPSPPPAPPAPPSAPPSPLPPRGADMYPVSAANFTAKGTADVLVNQYMTKWGCMTTLISDNGYHFCSKLSQAIYKLMRVHKVNTSSYHPQANGGTERVNHTMAQMLTVAVNERQTDWDLHLPHDEFAYNNSVNEVTGLAPNEVHMGRIPRIPLSVFDHPLIGGYQGLDRDQVEYCNLAVDRQRRSYALVRECYALPVSRIQRRNADLSKAFKPPDFVVG
eukprot:g6368.t1